jgi:hypothetical protein
MGLNLELAARPALQHVRIIVVSIAEDCHSTERGKIRLFGVLTMMISG